MKIVNYFMMQSLLGYVLYQDGYSAAMLAAWHGHTDVVVELVKAGAMLDLQNKVQNCISHSNTSQKNELS